MSYKMFLDDERHPIIDDYIIVRSFEEATKHIAINGLPEFITFDHDLGIGKNGFDVAKWIIDYCLDNGIYKLPEWHVHSQNPVGAKNIRDILMSAEKHLEYEKEAKEFMSNKAVKVNI